jgi:hypothetical protein
MNHTPPSNTTASGILPQDGPSNAASATNFNFMKSIILFNLLPSLALAGSFPGAVGSATTDAISKDSTALVAWASGHLTPSYGTGVDDKWKNPILAYGAATASIYDIVCLGNGGQIVMFFPRPIADGAGADFAVFENSFSPGFLELAYVEVSSDGTNFYRFPNRSEGTTAIGPFASTMDPTDLSGLAGKYIKGYGTPFDLAALAVTPLLDRRNVRFVRIVDIIGDGTRKDTTNQPIYDPTPTTGTGGFDLEAIGVIHQSTDQVKILRSELVAGAFQLGWESNPGSSYRIETSTELGVWTPVQTLTGNQTSSYTEISLPLSGAAQQFWRIVFDGVASVGVGSGSVIPIVVVPDRIGPTVQVTSRPPKSTSKTSILLKGTAKDANGITRVLVQVNKGPRKMATGTQSWRIKAPLRKGRNTISIFTTDSFGNETRTTLKVMRK